jgi:hypothetical protein
VYDLLSEAQGIIAELDLFAILSRHGEARLVGSVALDLIVKLDIDIHLLVGTSELLAVADNICRQILDGGLVHEVRLSDYRGEGGVKIGIDAYPARSGDWSIDLWVTEHLEATAFAFVDQMKAQLRPEHREAILAIKRDLFWRGELRQGLSMLIYQAVVEDGVRTASAFREWTMRRG